MSQFHKYVDMPYSCLFYDVTECQELWHCVFVYDERTPILAV